MAGKQKKAAVFDRCREGLATAGLQTSNDRAIICPLCWREAHFDRLTLEHIVPKSVGGRRRLLTCDTCNNGAGSELDWHLAGYQHMQDVMKGEAWLATEMNVNGARVAAELKIDQSGKEFRIVDKASNPADVEKSRADFAAGRVAEFKVTIPYGLEVNRYNTAVLKAGYLAAFSRFGYRYLLDENVQAIRRRIKDLTLEQPQVRTLVVGMNGLESIEDRQHAIIGGHVLDVNFILVMIRATVRTTSFMAVFLPYPGSHQPAFFETMEAIAVENGKFSVTFDRTAFIG